MGWDQKCLKFETLWIKLVGPKFEEHDVKSGETSATKNIFFPQTNTTSALIFFFFPKNLFLKNYFPKALKLKQTKPINLYTIRTKYRKIFSFFYNSNFDLYSTNLIPFHSHISKLEISYNLYIYFDQIRSFFATSWKCFSAFMYLN